MFGFHCLHDCLCISTATEPYVFHFRTSTIPLRSFFITSLICAPRGKRPPVSHEPRGNTTPFGPKLSKYGPQPIWSRLPTPRGLAQEIVHHVPNSINGNFITGAQQRQITMVLVFSALPFQAIQVFFNGERNYQQHILCKMLTAAKDKTPSVSIGQARGTFCEP